MHYFFNCLKENLKRKTNLINNFLINTFLCSILQLIVFFASVEISKVYDLEIFKFGWFDFYQKKKKKILMSYIFFVIFFFSSTLIFIMIIGENGLQVSNFVFFVLIIFELCIKIGKSKKFANWIGYELDENLRIFVLFIISLNIIYFLTRITYNISQINFY